MVEAGTSAPLGDRVLCSQYLRLYPLRYIVAKAQLKTSVSYHPVPERSRGARLRSPRQLWNALLLKCVLEP